MGSIHHTLEFKSENCRHIHIYGRPGVGKTRFALEVCKAAQWKDYVLYLQQENETRFHDLVASVIREPQSRVILVVDEVSKDKIKPLNELIYMAAGRVRLITIGHLAPPFESEKIAPIDVEALDDATAGALIKVLHPGMPLEHVDFVVRFSSGFARLLKLASDAVMKSPEIDTSALFRDEGIKDLMEKMLGGRSRRPLFVLACLTSIEWKSDRSLADNAYKTEGQIVSEHFGLDRDDVKASVNDFHRDYWIAPWAGDLSISPTPLGVYLALEAWETYREKIRTLHACTRLSERIQHSLRGSVLSQGLHRRSPLQRKSF